ncbi:MAG TPA: hypothetical protein PK052_11345 [Anaerohalosphaeraceae bacterium]|nr:hypothetical protein [Anaerohalosphaeraceae bacterium]HOM77381.1 hypothetical protein [Anaerohalosphaeraceae bacterium]HPC65328.1 hypothetical protein [Anaerohalosphaeraceae bacterium]HRS72754.1 hypothetical protein [Anaerohalosphaeraceae bacterium]HRV21139.1 hypothetical protein [Anaerohalosphaeraceae bacterium]
MQKPNELTQLLVKMIQLMQLDNPIGHRNLTLVPIKGPSSQLDYILGAEAIAAGTLTVQEISESGAVNTLTVENKGDRRVLLLDGEELIGAKQNRILNTTLLIEAHTTQKIPVSCVEQGRWRHISHAFAVGVYSPPEMRSKKSRAVSSSYIRCGQADSNQVEVWREVDKLCCDLRANAPTRAMKDVFDQRANDCNSYIRALPYPEGVRGVMAAVSGRFAAMDVLDKPAAFQRIWNRLVSGYAMDALRRKDKEHKPFTEKSAQFIMDSISDCQVSVFDAVGLGQELRFESPLILGQALVVQDCLVHISVFPNEANSRPDDPEYRIMPPSFRKRPRRP